ncbi:hypothetical protein HI914_00575 [Erysiphe necator]|nr:hypothetical protein HI914_00575 [Erysiphe necator]
MSTVKQRDLSEYEILSEIYSLPFPQVRQTHRNLTIELNEKQTQLRTIVGENYRQLLGTADTISHMNEMIRVAEDNLIRVSHACRKSAVNDLATGLNRFYKYQRTGKRIKNLQWFTILKALEAQVLTIGKLIRKHGASNDNENSLILAVKILAISTTLLKSIEELEYRRSEGDQQQVLCMKRKLDCLHQRLLATTEKALRVDAKNSHERIIQALTAYSLMKNSDIIDVLKYFLNLRENVITNYFNECSKNISTEVVKAITLFAWTLHDTPIIFSRALSENLSNLKIKPLLKDETLKKIEDLRFDEFEGWFSDYVHTFIPCIKHANLNRPLTETLLKAWETKISKLLLQNLSNFMKSQLNLKTIIELRNKIFGTWIEEGGNIKNLDVSEFLGELRKIINECVFGIVQQRCEALRHIFEEITITVASWEPGVTDKQASLWDKSILDMEVNNGADLFKNSIIARTNGRNDAVLTVNSCYNTWRNLIDEVLLYIDQMKAQKWYNDYEDLEEDVKIIARCNMLNKEDPQSIQQQLDFELSRAFKIMHEEIKNLLEVNEQNQNLGQISIFIFRIIRDIRSNLPPNNEIRDFGITLFDSLYDKLARIVIGDSLSAFIKFIEKQTIPGRVLWEGDPELTVQPSPAAFKLLYDLAIIMANSGQDLWTPNAIFILKELLSEELTSLWKKALEENLILEEISHNTENENEENLKSTSVRKEVMIQEYFDFSLILKQAFRYDNLNSNRLIKDLEELIITRGELNAAMQKRISESASDYWKKTHLLFGILA